MVPYHYTRKGQKEQVMLKSKIASIVTICTRHPWPVIAVAALLTIMTSVYSVGNFTIDTNVNKLISPDLPWRQRELAVDKAFPHRYERILAVVEAPTSELATQATAVLTEKLSGQPNFVRSVREPGGGPFFAKSGLLFMSSEEVGRTAAEFARSQALIQVLISDPNWRGLVQALSFSLAGIQRNVYTLDQMTRPLTMFVSP